MGNGCSVRKRRSTQGDFGIVTCSPDQRVWIVLHHHNANDQPRFSETRTGLDHVRFQVESYQQLELITYGSGPASDGGGRPGEPSEPT